MYVHNRRSKVTHVRVISPRTPVRFVCYMLCNYAIQRKRVSFLSLCDVFHRRLRSFAALLDGLLNNVLLHLYLQSLSVSLSMGAKSEPKSEPKPVCRPKQPERVSTKPVVRRSYSVQPRSLPSSSAPHSPHHLSACLRSATGLLQFHCLATQRAPTLRLSLSLDAPLLYF